LNLFKLSRRGIIAWLGGQSLLAAGLAESAESSAGGGGGQQSTPASGFNPRTAAEITAGVTPSDLKYPVLNVLRYGAAADGVSDDIAAFNKAVAVASVAGGAVYVPGGRTYLCGKNIDVTASNVRIYGDGQSSKIFFPNKVNRYSGITFNGTSAVHLTSAQVENLQLMGAGSSGPSGGGVLTTYCDNVRIFGVTAHDWSDNAFCFRNGSNCQIEHCTGHHIGQGISMFKPSANVIVNGNIFHSIVLYDGIDIEGGAEINTFAVISNNVVYGLLGNGSTGPTQGINIEDTAYASVTGNVVHDVPNGSCIHLFGAPFSSVTGNVAYNAGRSNVYSAGYGIYLGANTGGSTVVGNTTYKNGLGSMKLTDDATATSFKVLVHGNNFNEGTIVRSGNVSLVNTFGNTLANKGDFSDTVAVVGTSSLGSATYTKRAARYTVLDNLVHFNIQVAWSDHSGSGGIRINGLPFSSDDAADCPVTVHADGVALAAGNAAMGLINRSSNTIELYQPSASGASSEIALPRNCRGLALSGFYPMSGAHGL
jgi:hypothetical protein